MAVIHKANDHLEQDYQKLLSKRLPFLCFWYASLAYQGIWLLTMFDSVFDDVFCHEFSMFLLSMTEPLVYPFLWGIEILYNNSFFQFCESLSPLIGLILVLLYCLLLFVFLVFFLLWPVAVGSFFLAPAIKHGKSASILSAGIEGERIALKGLASLPQEYHVFQNLHIQFDGKTSETDFIIIGPTGVFVSEVKNYTGVISGNYADQQLTQTKGEHKSSFYNPIKQVSTHVFRLSHILREAGFDVWVQGSVLFTNEHCTLELNGTNNVPIFSNVSSLCSYILTYAPRSPLSLKTQSSIVRHLSNP